MYSMLRKSIFEGGESENIKKNEKRGNGLVNITAENSWFFSGLLSEKCLSLKWCLTKHYAFYQVKSDPVFAIFF